MTSNDAVVPAVAAGVQAQPATFDDPAELNARQLKADIVRARNELAATLDAIEYKLNVPKQLRIGTARLSRKFEVVREENPTALAAGVVGVAAAVGLAIFGIVQAVSKR